MMSWTIKPIGIIESPFREKFGTPRQSLLAPNITGIIRLLPPYDKLEALDGIEGFSHVWLQFGFHLNQREEHALKIRPPRLGGNAKVGVFASRSSFRPNSLGLSVVLNFGPFQDVDSVGLLIAGHDLVDGTPIFDIKPYLPRYDSHPEASEGWVNDQEFTQYDIEWSPEALEQLRKIKERDHLKEEIDTLLALHPMPTYKEADPNHQFGMHFRNLNVKWMQGPKALTIISLKVVK